MTVSLTRKSFNGRVWKGVPLYVDIGVVISLLSLAYWVGTQASEINSLTKEVTELKVEVHASTTVVDVAALKVRTDSQDRAMLEMRDYLGHRLDRIELKLDEQQDHKR